MATLTDRAGAEHALLALRPVLAASGIALGVATDGGEPFGPGEAELASAMPGLRRRDFLAGRRAARRALALAGLPVAEILADGRRPVFPDGCVGTISHSGGLAVALAAPASRFRALGCDLETRGLPLEAAHLVLSEDERAWVADSERRLLFAFSAKETAFKALSDPTPSRLLDVGLRAGRGGGFRAWRGGVPERGLDVRAHDVAGSAFTWTAR
ncbi:4'-phosphopantetheinyl transferase superfamily protein [Streptomyces sp. NPDC001407]|uniref:4'-phosphopantetheinyl transferase superfamily protein n=1 Tax=unclassified Streptomyces TaxID=2593676 RepID=UPI003410F93F